MILATHLLTASKTSILAAGPNNPAAAAFPIIVVVVGLAFLGYCLLDLSRARSVRYLPRWVWAIICVISIPLGGIIYLIVGKEW